MAPGNDGDMFGSMVDGSTIGQSKPVAVVHHGRSCCVEQEVGPPCFPLINPTQHLAPVSFVAPQTGLNTTPHHTTHSTHARPSRRPRRPKLLGTRARARVPFFPPSFQAYATLSLALKSLPSRTHPHPRQRRWPDIVLAHPHYPVCTLFSRFWFYPRPSFFSRPRWR